MPRKAINSSMSLETFEQLFTAIQERFNEQDRLIQQRFAEQDQFIKLRFDEQDKKMETILEVVKFYEIERKDLKSIILEHDIRLRKLEQPSI